MGPPNPSVVGDYSRVAYAEIHDDERAVTVSGVLRRAVALFGGLVRCTWDHRRPGHCQTGTKTSHTETSD